MQEISDVALAAFIAVYSGISPHKITTDISDPFEAIFHVRLSAEDFQKAKTAYVGDQTVTGIQTFVKEVRRLQALSIKCDKVGGILKI